ncbi:MAG: ATP-dependent Clp protease ATP-binding subunit ClpA, partial [Proteobacteria bacterium]|nr:ATP-dependent Clp protease ATP-binding subunit ClpA [Pseudomonadota bacterium]
MLGDDLRIALGMALENARRRRHEFLTVEHLLHGLLHEPKASNVLQACGADLKVLEEEVEEVLDGFEKLEIDEEYDPVQTIGFRRVLQRAIMHVQASSKGPVDGGHVLVAIFGEADSNAVYLLQRQGVSRLDVASFLSHGRRKDGKTREDVGAPTGAAEPSASKSPDEALAEFTTDLYQRASEGR